MTAEKAIAMVDHALERHTGALTSPLLEVCRWATQGGGRSRAVLLLVAAPEHRPEALEAATALEMLHAATLLQDDILDGGLMRRGRAAAHVQFGKGLAILASDWLLVRSLELAAEVDPRFFRTLAAAGRQMTQAEALELCPPTLSSFAAAASHEHDVIQGKTAVLFQAALGVAAALHALPEHLAAQWEELGLCVGTTYQLIDDCVDLYASEAAAQKSLRNDLPRGRLTLPLQIALSLLPEGRGHSPLAAAQPFAGDGRNVSPVHAVLHSPECKRRIAALLTTRLERESAAAEKAGLRVALESLLTEMWARLGGCQLRTAPPCTSMQEAEIDEGKATPRYA